MTALTAFVESRLPMVNYALGKTALPTRLDTRGLRSMSRYSVQQAFFYQLDWYIDKQVLLSKDAWTWVQNRYTTNAKSFWQARRHMVADFEKALPQNMRAGFSRMDIVYEHVFTGTMFWEGLERLYHRREMTTENVVNFIRDNYQTAWITRTENSRLPQSRRGETLLHAWQCYRAANIELKTGPSDDEQFDYPVVKNEDATPEPAIAAPPINLAARAAKLVEESTNSSWPLTLVGGIKDPHPTPGQRRPLAAFIPEAWINVERTNGAQRTDQWSTGLPLTFWLEGARNGTGEFALIAEVGPWHNPAQRDLLTAMLRDLTWTKNSAGGNIFWRFWRHSIPTTGNASSFLADAWSSIEPLLGDVEEALERAGMIKPGPKGE